MVVFTLVNYQVWVVYCERRGGDPNQQVSSGVERGKGGGGRGVRGRANCNRCPGPTDPPLKLYRKGTFAFTGKILASTTFLVCLGFPAITISILVNRSCESISVGPLIIPPYKPTSKVLWLFFKNIFEFPSLSCNDWRCQGNEEPNMAPSLQQARNTCCHSWENLQDNLTWYIIRQLKISTLKILQGENEQVVSINEWTHILC